VAGDLTSLPVESVSRVEPADDGWQVVLNSNGLDEAMDQLVTIFGLERYDLNLPSQSARRSVLTSAAQRGPTGRRDTSLYE
jgi:hypothetical protein